MFPKVVGGVVALQIINDIISDDDVSGREKGEGRRERERERGDG